MSEYKSKFSVGDIKKLKFGSAKADMVRKAANSKGMEPNDYVKKSALEKANIKSNLETVKQTM